MSVVPGHLLARLSVLGAFVLSGCYTYVPVEQPAPGTPVRVRMPVSSAVEGSSRIPESVMIEGRVIAFTDTLRMEMRNEQRMGTRSFVAVDTIRIAASSLADLEERVFSRSRTAVFAGALLGGVALATWGIATVTGGDDGGKPDPPPTTDPPVIFGSFGHGLRFLGIAVPFP